MLIKTCILTFLGIFLVSCSSETRKFYVLTPTAAAPSGGGPGIGIGPLTMADYLVERPYVAFQSSPTRVELSEMHEWAGDLRDDFARTLGTNLGRRKGSGSIRIYPWDKESEIRYQVTVDVHRFHGTTEGDALLEASWRAYALPGSRLLASRTTTLREDLRGDGFDELVAAQSRLVDRLASVIAAKLR